MISARPRQICPHDLVASEDGWKLRYVRLTVTELPYGQTPLRLRSACLRTGRRQPARETCRGNGGPSDAAGSGCELEGWSRYFRVGRGKSWDPAVGYVVNWGFAPDKLYHSYQVFDERVSIGGLVKDQALYLRVDSFNENGITEGDVKKII